MARRISFVSALAALLLASISPGVATAGIGTNFDLKLSDCEVFNWVGRPYTDWSYNKPSQSNGTLNQCAYLYKGIESDPNADYWMIEQRVTWTITNDESWWGYNASYDNPAIGIVTSTATASDWSATESAVFSQGDCINLSVGASVPPFSVSLPVRACGTGGSLRLITEANNGARWDTANILLARKWDSAYIQRVAPGAKPTMRAYVYYPKYAVFDTGTTRCQYYCLTVWGTSPITKSNMIALSV